MPSYSSHRRWPREIFVSSSVSVRLLFPPLPPLSQMKVLAMYAQDIRVDSLQPWISDLHKKLPDSGMPGHISDGIGDSPLRWRTVVAADVDSRLTAWSSIFDVLICSRAHVDAALEAENKTSAGKDMLTAEGAGWCMEGSRSRWVWKEIRAGEKYTAKCGAWDD